MWYVDNVVLLFLGDLFFVCSFDFEFDIVLLLLFDDLYCVVLCLDVVINIVEFW